jgi:hypothetical protein
MPEFLFHCTEKVQREDGFSIYFKNLMSFRGFTGYGDGSCCLNNVNKDVADCYEVGKNYNIEIIPVNEESEV